VLHLSLELTELRIVNNNIKHHILINNQVKKIKEFNNSKEFKLMPLIEFYNRVEKPALSFLKEIGESIISDIYEFDDSRIDKLVTEFKNRMNPEMLSEFSKKLKKHSLR
jgi:hypothetical protein